MLITFISHFINCNGNDKAEQDKFVNFDEYKQLVISINRELESIECPIRNETIENILEKREEWGRLLYNYALTNETKIFCFKSFLMHSTA